MKSRGACARGRLTSLVLLYASRLWAQVAEPLPPAPPAPPGVEPAVAAPAPSTPAPSTPAPSSPALSTPAPSTPAPSTPAPSSSTALAPRRFETDRDWYGWQIMINDFVALGSLGGAAVAGLRDKTALAVIVPAAVVFDLGGPTIHWLHHRRGIAGASFGVRVGVPFIGVLIGSALANCERGSGFNSCRSSGAGYGALAGFAAATAIDASLFAWDPPKAEPARASGLAWAPTVTPLDGGAAAGVIGRF